MALIECHFFAETLGLCMTMNVILPQRAKGQIGMAGTARNGKHPALYLLHGMSDDHSIWLRRTSIERYVAPLGLAVVMPAVHRSFYSDLEHGGAYWKFISEEVPRLAREFFPLSDRREDNFVAGLSMGGFGAFKLGLNCPESFCAAASLSGALWVDFPGHYNSQPPERRMILREAYGDPAQFEGSINDLAGAARRIVASGSPKPRLYQCCGTEDFLYQANQQFRQFIEPLGFDYTYEEEPGAHEWGYWDMKIQRVLQWLPLAQNQ